MSKLTDQYPMARQLSATKVSSDDPQQLIKLIEPYLDWELADIDTETADILIRNSRAESEHNGEYSLVILDSSLAFLWLQNRRQ